MKKQMKRIASILLSFSLILTGLPFSMMEVHAATTVNHDGTSYHFNQSIATTGQLTGAMESSPENGYFLSGNITLTETWSISDKTIHLDLNGYTINMNGNGRVISLAEGAELYLFDSSSGGNGTVTGGNAADGGGVYINSGCTLHQYGGKISGNTSTGDCGGVRNMGTYNLYGGGLYDNTADANCGGLGNNGVFNMYGGEINGNTAIGTIGGGGVYNTGNGTMHMYDGSISGNKSTNTGALGGGGIFTRGNITIDGGSISGNTSAADGGGIFGDSVLKINGCTIENNTSTKAGAGIFSTKGININSEDAAAGAKDVIIQGNTAATLAGGIFIRNTSSTIKNAKIIGNTSDGLGGGIYGEVDLNLQYAEVSDNKSRGDGGGGMNITGGTTKVMDSVISGNSAPLWGGGYRASGGTTYISDSTISNNEAGYGGGGADFSGGDTIVTISNSTISGNQSKGASNQAGGIQNGSQLTLNNGTIVKENTAVNDGGGINSSGTLTVSDATIEDNTAGGSGGGIYQTGTLKISGNVRILDNTATRDGGTSNINMAAKSPIQITGPLGNDARIGIFSSLGPQMVTSSYGTHNPDAAADAYFFSDQAGLWQMKLSNGEVELAGHEHQWQYSQQGDSVEAICVSADTCDCYHREAALKLRIKADVKSKWYNGKATGASIINRLPVASGAEIGDIYYIGTEGTAYEGSEPPAAAGTYLACVDVHINENIYTIKDDFEIKPGIYYAYQEPAGGETVYQFTQPITTAEELLQITGSDKSVTKTTGYYLDKDIEIEQTWNLQNTEAYLDLNGHQITMKGNGRVIDLASNSTLYLFDSNSGESGRGIVSGGSAQEGAGIYVNEGCTFVQYGGTICNNAASADGGGVKNTGTYRMYGGSVSENTAAARGGGIHNQGTFTVVKGSINNNTAEERAGGIYQAGTMELSGNTIIRDNKADDADSNLHLASGCIVTVNGDLSNDKPIGLSVEDAQTLTGGYGAKTNNAVAGRYFKMDQSKAYRISLDNGELKAEKNTFNRPIASASQLLALTGSSKSNTADNGYYLSANITLSSTWTITDADIHLDLNGYQIRQNGNNGIISIASGSSLSLYDGKGTGKITGGKGVQYGAGVNNGGTFNLYGGSIVSNISTLDGGGVYNHGTFNMYGGTISKNEAPQGAGAYLCAGSVMNLYDGVISENKVSSYGGGIFAIGGTLNMSGGIIEGNTSGNLGGGICTYTSGTPSVINITGGTIRENHAVTGGGIYNGIGKVNITGGSICKNTATTGAGINSQKGSLTVTGGQFEENAATQWGGGIRVESGCTTTVDGAVVQNNTAVNGSGGFDVGGTCTITNTIIKGNEGAQGAGVLSNSSGNCTLGQGTVITGNRGTAEGGGAYVTGGTLTVNGAKITGNSALAGSGIYSAGTLNISGSTVVTCNTHVNDGSANNVELAPNKVISITGSLAGCDIGVSQNNWKGVITSGYNTYHNGAAADAYLHPDRDDKMSLTAEGEIQMGYHIHTLKYESEDNDTIIRCVTEDGMYCPIKEKGQRVILDASGSSKSYDGMPAEKPVVRFENNYDSIVKTSFGAIYYKGAGTTQYASSLIPPTEPGRYKATITIGGALSVIEDEFRITGKPLTEEQIVLSFYTKPYTGREYQPDVSVREGNAYLTEGVDYVVDGEIGVRPGTYTISVTGKNGYSGTITKSWRITEGSLDGLVEAENLEKNYDGTGGSISVNVDSDLPDPIVEYRTEDGEYTTENPAFKNVGSYKVYYRVSCRSYGSLEGSADVVINPSDIADLADRFALEYEEVKFNGKPHTPKVTAEGLLETDYEVSYSDHTEIGTGKVILTGQGNCTGSLELTFEIVTGDISKMNPRLSYTKIAYDGTEKQPEVLFDEGVGPDDYTVSYAGNTEIGTATVTVTGQGRYEGSLELTFEIKGTIELSELDIHMEYEKTYWDGTPKEPAVTIGGLTANKDYLITYENNTAVGTAEVVITGSGSYEGRAVLSFFIAGRLEEDSVNLAYTSIPYDGTVKNPLVSVNCAGNSLQEGEDYTLSYGENLHAGSGTVTIEGKGSYEGTIEKTFTIETVSLFQYKARLEHPEMEDDGAMDFDGTAKEPRVIIEGVDPSEYTVTYKNNVGLTTSAQAVVTGNGDYVGTVTLTFKIRGQMQLSTDDVKLSYTQTTYDGYSKKPAVRITGLVNGQHYTISYANNVNAGTGKVIINGIGIYKGTYTKTFRIKPATLTATHVRGVSASAYDGKTKSAGIAVTFDGARLKNGTDYSVSGAASAVNAGTYRYTVSGKGNYAGIVTKTWKITAKSASSAKVSLSKTKYVYNGKAQKPAVTVKLGSKTLKKGTDYTVSYASGRKNVGTYKVTVKFKGNYSGSAKSASFVINPKAAKLKSVKAGKKAITVKWSKVSSQATGYEILLATNSKFTKSKKTVKVTRYKTTSKKVSKLKAKKKYFVKVRTYKTVKGKKYYSAWSTFKRAKTK